jgi:hypothetical protein
VVEALKTLLAIVGGCSGADARAAHLRRARHRRELVYPLLTVHLPHRNFAHAPLSHSAHTARTIIPALFLELTYHLSITSIPRSPATIEGNWRAD